MLRNMDKETVAVYDKQVADYVELTTSEQPDESLKRFIARLPERAHVLDLGCGPGASAAAMKRVGLSVDATDASAEMVRAANELFNIDARVATFQDIDSVATYDGIWVNFSLLHATEKEFIDILPRLHRALKPEGLLFLGMKTGEGNKRDRLGRRYTYYTEDQLTELLSAASFETITSEHGEGVGLVGGVEPFVLMTFRAVLIAL